MELFARRRRRRSSLLVATAMIAVAAAVVIVRPWEASWWPGSDDAVASPVPTVPVAATPVDIGCVQLPGEITATADQWYPPEAAGSVAFAVEITMSSNQLARLADLVIDASADMYGSFATSAIRDLAPDPGFCTTHHYVEVTLNDGSQIIVTAWRSVAAAAPRTIPNEGEFIAIDESTFASTGPHLVSVLAVAPDGTSVLVSAYGKDAYDAINDTGGLVTTSLDPAAIGAAPATADELVGLAHDALAALAARTPAG